MGNPSALCVSMGEMLLIEGTASSLRQAAQPGMEKCLASLSPDVWEEGWRGQGIVARETRLKRVTQFRSGRDL